MPSWRKATWKQELEVNKEIHQSGEQLYEPRSKQHAFHVEILWRYLAEHATRPPPEDLSAWSACCLLLLEWLWAATDTDTTKATDLGPVH
jgi:hypothetical protein